MEGQLYLDHLPGACLRAFTVSDPANNIKTYGAVGNLFSLKKSYGALPGIIFEGQRLGMHSKAFIYGRTFLEWLQRLEWLTFIG